MLILGGRIYTMENSVYDPGYIKIKNEKILNLGPESKAPTPEEGEKVALIQYLPLCAGLAVKYGLPMEEGLKALTINPARICRVEERVGSLKPGKDADIAIFSGNPMEVFTKTLYTIIDGEIVYEDSENKNSMTKMQKVKC